MTTLLTEDGPRYTGAAEDRDGELWLTLPDFDSLLGWSLKPEGLCRGALCVPLAATLRDAMVRSGRVNVSGLWQALGWPMASSPATETWVFGSGVEFTVSSLQSLQAPDFALPDLDGRMHRLSDHRGSKVLLATWASW